ncbi:MAG: hypothetical protein ACOCWR_02005 [Oceanidesulfovibrio sp.]
MTAPRTILDTILQDAYTAGYAAPAFIIHSADQGLPAIQAAAAEGSPILLVLNAADFPASGWRAVCDSLTDAARAAYGENFAFALALQGVRDASLIPQAAAAGFALCAAADDSATDAIREAGMFPLRGCSMDCLGLANPGPDDVLAFAPGSLPELSDLVRATSMLPNVPLAVRPGPDVLASAEPADATFFPTREHPIRAAVRTGVCLVIFDADGAPTSEQVAEAARLTAAQGAARLMDHSS